MFQKYLTLKCPKDQQIMQYGNKQLKLINCYYGPKYIERIFAILFLNYSLVFMVAPPTQGLLTTEHPDLDLNLIWTLEKSEYLGKPPSSIFQ